MNESYPDVLTIDEAAKYLRISKSSLYKLAQEGKIPCQKVGRHWRFSIQALSSWLGQLPKHQQSDTSKTTDFSS